MGKDEPTCFVIIQSISVIMKASTCISTLLASVPLALAAFREGCPEASWDSDVDFWETKFESSESNPFAAEYNNTFVKIRNRQRTL